MLSLGTVLRQRIEKIVCSFVCDLDIDEVVPAHTFVETAMSEIRLVTDNRRLICSIAVAFRIGPTGP